MEGKLRGLLSPEQKSCTSCPKGQAGKSLGKPRRSEEWRGEGRWKASPRHTAFVPGGKKERKGFDMERHSTNFLFKSEVLFTSTLAFSNFGVKRLTVMWVKN